VIMLSNLLQGLLEHPHEEDRWLILADWVEEYDDPRRAELLRLHRQLLATCTEPDRHPQRSQWQSQLVSLLTYGVQPVVPRQTIELDGGVDMKFVWIPPGPFLMGSPENEPDRSSHEKQHRVTLTEGFWLGIHPVTQAQWQAVMGSDPSRIQGADLPVEQVSWQGCQEFVETMATKVGPGVRLPTEAEWEYACRAGTTTPFFFGQSISTDQANYNGNFPYAGGPKGVYRNKTTSVGTFSPNAWGLYDMHGNVWEWCEDWYRAYLTRILPLGAGPSRTSKRALRGGSFDSRAKLMRSAYRYGDGPWSSRDDIGLRVARTL
jgi:formylglycine-generating enzyme